MIEREEERKLTAAIWSDPQPKWDTASGCKVRPRLVLGGIGGGLGFALRLDLALALAFAFALPLALTLALPSSRSRSRTVALALALTLALALAVTWKVAETPAFMETSSSMAIRQKATSTRRL